MRWIPARRCTSAGRRPPDGVHDLRDGVRLTIRWSERAAGRNEPIYTARGRLYPAAVRLVRFARVHVEVIAHDSHALEVTLRPVCGGVHRWGRRRSSRYFRAAHAAADYLVTELQTGTSVCG